MIWFDIICKRVELNLDPTLDFIDDNEFEQSHAQAENSQICSKNYLSGCFQLMKPQKPRKSKVFMWKKVTSSWFFSIQYLNNEIMWIDLGHPADLQNKHLVQNRRIIKIRGWLYLMHFCKTFDIFKVSINRKFQRLQISINLKVREIVM